MNLNKIIKTLEQTTKELRAIQAKQPTKPSKKRATRGLKKSIQNTWTDPTGLVWYPALEGTYTHQEALDKAASMGLRLPTKEEFEKAEKAGLRTHFDDFKDRWFWSSSSDSNVRFYAWSFYGGNGYVGGNNRSNTFSVRCVSR